MRAFICHLGNACCVGCCLGNKVPNESWLTGCIAIHTPYTFLYPTHLHMLPFSFIPPTPLSHPSVSSTRLLRKVWWAGDWCGEWLPRLGWRVSSQVLHMFEMLWVTLNDMCEANQTSSLCTLTLYYNLRLWIQNYIFMGAIWSRCLSRHTMWDWWLAKVQLHSSRVTTHI